MLLWALNEIKSHEGPEMKFENKEAHKTHELPSPITISELFS